MSPRLVLSLKLLLEQIVEFYFAWRERAWKRKAVKRGMKVRDLRKKVNRLQQRRAVVLAENASLIYACREPLTAKTTAKTPAAGADQVWVSHHRTRSRTVDRGHR